MTISSIGKNPKRSTKRLVGTVVFAVALMLLPLQLPSMAAVSDCIDASCRISVGDSRGTGCVFAEADGQLLVLTNAHVVGRAETVSCEFWRDGHLSNPVAGRVVARVENELADAAIVSLPKTPFANRPPKIVPLAKPDHVVRSGETIYSVGCAKGSWATTFKGHIVDQRGADTYFLPPPADGRSGSALFDASGEHIVGLVRARTLENPRGVACSIRAIHAALGNTQVARQTQCFGGICSPWRASRPQNPTPQGQVWPTLPPAAAVDLSETNRKLDEIADLLKGSLPTRPMVPVVPPTTPIDGASQQRLEQAEQSAAKAEEAVQQVERRTVELQEGLTGLHCVVSQVTGDLQTLPERVQARLKKVKSDGAESSGEIARAYAKDYLVEKAGNGTLGWTLGKVIGGALGLSGPLGLAVAAGAWLVSRRIGNRIESGDPLLVTRLVSRLSDRIDDLRDRVAQNDAPARRPSSKEN